MAKKAKIGGAKSALAVKSLKPAKMPDLSEPRLVLDKKTSKDDWLAVGKLLLGVQNNVQFLVGDWLAFGEGKKYATKELYEEASRWTGLDSKLLQDYKSVAKHCVTRVAGLSWSHHRAVMGLDRADQEFWLESALKERWGVREMESQMRKLALLDEPKPKKEKEEDEGAEDGGGEPVAAGTKFATWLYNFDFTADGVGIDGVTDAIKEAVKKEPLEHKRELARALAAFAAAWLKEIK